MAETTITIAVKFTHFVKLELEQSFNKHHRFNELIDYEELDKKS